MIGPLTQLPIKAELSGGGPALVTVPVDGDFAELLDLGEAPSAHTLSAFAAPAQAISIQSEPPGSIGSSQFAGPTAAQGTGDGSPRLAGADGLEARVATQEKGLVADLFRVPSGPSGANQSAQESTAEQFNERGWFFASVQAGSPQFAPAVAITPADVGHPATEFEAAGAPLPLNVPRDLGAAAQPFASSETHGTPRAATVAWQSAPARDAGVRAGLAWALIENTEEVDIVGPLRPSTPRLLPRIASTAPVAVAVHELAAGITIAAHVGELDENDRGRLRVAIAGLLARHGFVATSVKIFGPPLRGVR